MVVLKIFMRKSIYLFFVVLMFCVVVSSGCGGGGGSSSNFSDNPDNEEIINEEPGEQENDETPDTPNNPEPNEPNNPSPTPESPDVPPRNTFWPNVNGTWKVETAEFINASGRVDTFIRSEPATFEIISIRTNHDDYEALAFAGEGVQGSGEWYSSINIFFLVIEPVLGEELETVQSLSAVSEEEFDYAGNNTYNLKPEIRNQLSNAYDRVISFPDDNTIIHDIQWLSTQNEMKVTLKRVN